ncbi:MAG: hypothetical protein ACRCXT_08995 [Paraclostridium sp.]
MKIYKVESQFEGGWCEPIEYIVVANDENEINDNIKEYRKLYKSKVDFYEEDFICFRKNRGKAIITEIGIANDRYDKLEIISQVNPG